MDQAQAIKPELQLSKFLELGCVGLGGVVIMKAAVCSVLEDYQHGSLVGHTALGQLGCTPLVRASPSAFRLLKQRAHWLLATSD